MVSQAGPKAEATWPGDGNLGGPAKQFAVAYTIYKIPGIRKCENAENLGDFRFFS